jgi:hypothetical protein
MIVDPELVGLLATGLSGSAGDVIASRNQWGPYFRPRSGVIQRNTACQVAMQENWGNLEAVWAGLEREQRAAWDRNHFFRANALRLLAGLEAVVERPAPLTLGPPGEFDIVSSADSSLISWSDGVWPFSQDGAVLQVQISGECGGAVGISAGRTTWHTPVHRVADVLGSSAEPPGGVAIEHELGAGAGKIGWRFRFVDAAGRISVERRQVSEVLQGVGVWGVNYFPVEGDPPPDLTYGGPVYFDEVGNAYWGFSFEVDGEDGQVETAWVRSGDFLTGGFIFSSTLHGSFIGSWGTVEIQDGHFLGDFQLENVIVEGDRMDGVFDIEADA